MATHRIARVRLWCAAGLGVLGAACADGPASTAPMPLGGGARLEVVMSDTAAAAGALVTVSVVAHAPDDLPPLGAFRFRLVAAPGALEYVGAGDSTGVVPTAAMRGDTVYVAGASVAGYAGGRLATLRFRTRVARAAIPALIVDEVTDVAFADRRSTFVAGPRVSFARMVAPAAPTLAPRADIGAASVPVYGDAIVSGVVDATDALAILTVAAGLDAPAGYDAGAADATADGSVTALDAQVVLFSLVNGEGSTRFRVGDEVGSAPVTVDGVAPGLLVPGATVTLSGTNFDPDASKDVVTLDGVPVTASAATAATVTFTVPADMPCRATHDAPLAVRANGATGRTTARLQVAAQHAALALGETWLATPADFQCVEIPVDGNARYFVAVYNTARADFEPPVGYKLTGAPVFDGSPVSAAPRRVAPAPSRQRLAWASLAGPSSALARYRATLMRRRNAAHLRQLARSAELMRRARYGPLRAAGRRTASGARATLLPPANAARSVSATVGTMASLRVQDANDYAQFTEVRARTVWSGARTIIVEDSLAPLAGKMDAQYRALGEEFERTVLPMLDADFGNVLAMDANTDNNGKMVMLFTPVINNQYPDLFAFVTSCDFFGEADCPSTNRGEFFYAMVPTRADGDVYSPASPDGWLRFMRGVVAHEAKHVVSFAERLSRGGVDGSWPEEPWLEEATAQVASELYARTVYHTTWKGNAAYRQTVYCDWRPDWDECAGAPYLTGDHFGFLYDYEASVDENSPIGYGPAIYGGGWMLARWAADRYASGEATFFKALTQQTTSTGVDNLEARTGKSWEELLGRWALALAADDYPGLPGGDALIASWNTRDVFQGLYDDFIQDPGWFDSPTPLRRREMGFDTFLIQNAVASGSASFVDLNGWASGNGATRQMLSLHGVGDIAVPAGAALRVAVMRVQ